MLPLKSAEVTYPYGVKNSRFVKGYHTGIDMVSSDTAVYAAAAGTVLEARYAPGKGADPAGWGNYVIVRTADGRLDLIYAHLSSVQAVKGKKVGEGAVLGRMGSTGNSTGLHLHFEVRKMPWTNRDDIDPAVFLGIYNREGPAEMLPLTPGEDEETGKVLKDLILCHPGPDERAAAYLADCLKAPVCYLANARAELIDLAGRIYVVGSKEKPSPETVNIIGTDRYDTCRKVLDICGKS